MLNLIKYKNEYVSLDEASKMLEMEGSYSVRIDGLKVLNLKTIKVDKNKKLYLKKDLEKSIAKVLAFFKEYATPDEYGFTDIFVKSKGLESVTLPKGYNAMFYKRRYGDKPFKIHKNCYKRAVLKELYNSCKNTPLSEKYIPTKEAIKLLGLDILSEEKASKIISLLGIERITRSDGKSFKGYCEINSLNKTIRELSKFYEEYCVVDESDLDNKVIEKNLQRITMPKGYNYIFYKNRLGEKEIKVYKSVYKKSDIELLKKGNFSKPKKKYYKKSKKNNTQSPSLDKFISLYESEKLLDCSKARFQKIRKEFNFKEVRIGEKIYLDRNVINEFLAKRNEFYQKYITSSDITLEYLNGNSNRAILPKLKSYEAPFYFVTNKNSVSIGKVGVFKRCEVEQLLKDINYGSISHTDINGNTPFETFEARLNNSPKWEGDSKESEFTYTEWFKHVKKTLKKSNCNEGVMSSKINTYVQCTLLLKNLLDNSKKKEIYMFTTNEINLFQRGIPVLMQRTYLYYFIREVYQEIGEIYGPSKLAYKIASIDKPPRTNGKSNNYNKDEDVIYDFETYAEVFKYELEIDYHVKKNIKRDI